MLFLATVLPIGTILLLICYIIHLKYHGQVKQSNSTGNVVDYSANLAHLAGEADRLLTQSAAKTADYETVRTDAQTLLTQVLENHKSIHVMEQDLQKKQDLHDQLERRLKRVQAEVESERAYIQVVSSRLNQDTEEETDDEVDPAMELLGNMVRDTAGSLHKVLHNIEKTNNVLGTLTNKQTNFLEHSIELQMLKEQRDKLTQELRLLDRIGTIHEAERKHLGGGMGHRTSQSAFKKLTNFFTPANRTHVAAAS